MRTLDQHNRDQLKISYELDSTTPKHNGIECPECGKELYDTNPQTVLASLPPKKAIHCKCGFKGYRIA